MERREKPPELRFEPSPWRVPLEVSIVEDPDWGPALRYVPTPMRVPREAEPDEPGIYEVWDLPGPSVELLEEELEGIPEYVPEWRPRPFRLTDDREEAVVEEFLRLFGGRHPPRDLEDLLKKRSSDLRAFVERYGVLGFCEHGVPSPSPQAGPDLLEAHGEVPGCLERNPEPLAFWWDFGRGLASVSRLAQSVRLNRKPDSDEQVELLERLANSPVWSPLVGRVSESEADWTPGRFLAHCLQRLFDLAEFHPLVDYGLDVRPMAARIRSGLFEALVRRFVFAAVGAAGFMFCDGCHLPYVRRARIPNPGNRNYCPDCRTNRVPQRDAMRRMRRKGRKP